MTTPASNAVPATREFPKLVLIENNLVDNITMIEAGEILAIYGGGDCRVFHKLPTPVDLSERRVVYLDCNSLPGLLDKGEWEWYIHDRIPTVTELSYGDELRTRIIEQKTVPNRTYIKLGY
jgi:hypothetical protein